MISCDSGTHDAGQLREVVDGRRTILQPFQMPAHGLQQMRLAIDVMAAIAAPQFCADAFDCQIDGAKALL